MKLFKTLGIATLITSALFGCTTFGTIERHDNVRKKIEDDFVDVVGHRDYQETTPFIRKFNRVYVDNLSIEDVKMPEWYRVDRKFSAAKNIMLVDLLQQIFIGIPVNLEFLEGVDKNKKVSIPDLELSYGETLEYISSLTGYSHKVSGRSVIFNKYETAIFPIRHLPGQESFVVGKKGMRSENGGQNRSSQSKIERKSGDFIGGSEQEYSVLEGSIDVLSDVKRGVDTILGCFQEQEVKSQNVSSDLETTELSSASNNQQKTCNSGASSQVLRSSSSILVRALPSQMREVERFVTDKNGLYTRQVSVQISLINVEFTDETQFNVDMDLVTESVSNSLKATAKTTASSGILGGLDPRGVLTLTSTGNAHAGSELYLEALSHQGAVTKKTFPRVIATNNHVGVVGNIDRVNYISGRETFTTASVGSQNAIVQSEAETGFLLYCLPNVGDHDAILKLSTSQSALLDLDTKGEGDQLVESPIINDKLFNTTIRVEYGKPVLIAGLSATLSQANGSESGLIPTGVSRSSKEKAVETILMIEVVRL